MGWLSGTGLTWFGRHGGQDTLDLMGQAAAAALAEAGLRRSEVDGLLTGYSTTLPHLMLSTLFAERFGLAPACARLWYLRHPACPRCGHAPPERTEATGLGTVVARTVVRRAPRAVLRDLVPYAILLVDAAEGFRFIAHGLRPI